MAANRDAVIVIGAGGHARPVIETLRLLGIPIAALLDEVPEGPPVLGIARAGGLALLGTIPAGGAIIAVGHNPSRLRLAALALEARLSLPLLVHPMALVSPSAVLGEGVQVMPRAVVGPEAMLGRLCLINTGAIVEHECRLGEAVHLAPGAILCGGVVVEDAALLGAGCSVIPGRRIGAGAVVAAGAAVVRDVAAEARVAGVPATG